MASSTDTKSNSRSSRRRLGRGLGSLLSTPVNITSLEKDDAIENELAAQGVDIVPARTEVTPAELTKERQSSTDHDLRMISVGSIRPNPRQPRKHFDDESLASLAESIKVSGMIQPIVLRPCPDGSSYELIAGERRWRAAQKAEFQTIPAVIMVIDDCKAAELALVENLQRKDLNPIERAQAFQTLIDEFGLTHQEIAASVGMSRSSVSNIIRLLELEETIINQVRQGDLSLGHARALLGVPRGTTRSQLANRVIKEAWSVRELERRIQLLEDVPATGSQTFPDEQSNKPVRSHLDDLEERLSLHLGTKVRIKAGSKKGTGKLVIEFYSLDEFDGLMRRIGFDTQS